MNRVLDMSNEFENVADNRFSSGQGYSYDLNGNVTQDATGQRFGYDAENHQKEFFAAGNATSNPDATYLYDGEGRRVKKTTPRQPCSSIMQAGRLWLSTQRHWQRHRRSVI